MLNRSNVDSLSIDDEKMQFFFLAECSGDDRLLGNDIGGCAARRGS